MVNSFELLELALDARLAEKHTAASYLASLEARRLQPKEKLSEYVADINKLVNKGHLQLTSRQGRPLDFDTFRKVCFSLRWLWQWV